MSWKKNILFFYWQTALGYLKQGYFHPAMKYRDKWAISMKPGSNSVADESPWLTFPAIDFLEKNIRPGNKVFEYGGGGSTLFFCKKGAEVVTVEDNNEWFGILTRTVQGKKYSGTWEGHFIPAEQVASDTTRDHANPDDFKSASKGCENMSFERYARAIHRFPEDYFDVVLVDGRARASCIRQALPHLKKGGLLVIDNTERSYYLTAFADVMKNEFITELHLFAPSPYAPDFTRTTILRKMAD
jgi:hypothetical protein